MNTHCSLNKETYQPNPVKIYQKFNFRFVVFSTLLLLASSQGVLSIHRGRSGGVRGRSTGIGVGSGQQRLGRDGARRRSSAVRVGGKAAAGAGDVVEGRRCVKVVDLVHQRVAALGDVEADAHRAGDGDAVHGEGH